MHSSERELLKLAQDVGIGLRLQRGLPGMMYVEHGYVEGPTIDACGPYPNEEACIMTVLHELGHAVYDHTQGRPPFENKTRYFDQGVLHSEAEAWEWALDMGERQFGLKTFAEYAQTFMWSTCLGSYYRGAAAAKGASGQRLHNGDRGYHAFIYDEPDEYFWQVAERLSPKALEAHIVAQ